MSNRYNKLIKYAVILVLISISLISLYTTYKLNQSLRVISTSINICETRHVDSLYPASSDTIVFSENYELIHPNSDNFSSFKKGLYIQFTKYPNSRFWEQRTLVVTE